MTKLYVGLSTLIAGKNIATYLLNKFVVILN